MRFLRFLRAFLGRVRKTRDVPMVYRTTDPDDYTRVANVLLMACGRETEGPKFLNEPAWIESVALGVRVEYHPPKGEELAAAIVEEVS